MIYFAIGLRQGVILFDVFGLVFATLRFPYSPEDSGLRIEDMDLSDGFGAGLVITLTYATITGYIDAFNFYGFGRSFYGSEANGEYTRRMLTLMGDAYFCYKGSVFIGGFLIRIFGMGF